MTLLRIMSVEQGEESRDAQIRMTIRSECQHLHLYL